MRFLCLHGKGTTAEIFEIQTRAIRAALGSHHEFEFYEGEYDESPAPGIDAVFPGRNYKAWFSPYASLTSLNLAKMDIHDIMAEKGPFDGCIGFSQGGLLLASIILDYQAKNRFAPPLFRLAVFICAGKPLYQDIETGEWYNHTLKGFKKLRIPTVHIYGQSDPFVKESLYLKDLCDERMRVEVDHGAGHEIPWASESTKRMTQAIEKGMRLAGCA